MKTLLFIWAVCLPLIGVEAQNYFSKSFAASPDTADTGLGIVKMEDGYLIGCGPVNQQNGREYAALLKLDWDANLVWNKSYYWEPYQPDIGFHHPIGILDGKIYMSCQTESDSMGMNFLLLCLNLAGDTLWSKQYPETFDDFNFGLTPLIDSSLLLYGNKGTTSLLDVARLIKIDKEGNVIWEKTHGGEFGRNFPKNVHELNGSSLIIASVICHNGANCLLERNAALTKLDKDGNKVWTKTYDQSEGGAISWVLPLDNGRFALGWTRDTFHWSTDPYPPVIYFLDSLGNEEYDYTFFGVAKYLTKLKRMSNGDILGVGYTYAFPDGSIGGWLFRMTQAGELIWERKIADWRYPDLYGEFWDAIETPDGGIIATGIIVTNNWQNAEVWVVKLNGEGCMEPGCTDEFIYFTPVEENGQADMAYFEISPNPANGSFSIKISEAVPVQGMRLEILDLSGRKLEEAKIESHVQSVNTSALSNGMYFVRLSSGAHPTLSKKIVISR